MWKQIKYNQALFLVMLIFAVMSVCSCMPKSYVEEEEMLVGLSEAKLIGLNEIKRRGFELKEEDLEIEADNDNTRWKDYNKIVSNPNNLIMTLKYLDGKEYWAIHYGRKIDTSSKVLYLDGDYWVFIEKKTGKILFVK